MTETQERDPDKASSKKTMSTGRKTVVVLLAILLVVTAGVVGFGWWVQRHLDGMIERIDDPFGEIASRPEIPDDVLQQAEENDTDLPVNILVLGSDSRISAGDPSQWERGAQRTDAIMLFHISGDRESAAVVSIPRDTWVSIPNHGPGKINAAYSYGGPPLMIETVEQLTDVKIDHFAVTDFESFSTMTDALDSVPITLNSPLNVDGETLAAGEQRLNGEQALTYVRQRYGLSGGDFSRVQRQQNWMRSIMREVFEKNILGDLGKLTNFIETVASSVAVDEGFSFGEIRDLAYSSRNLRPGNVNFLTMPHNGTGSSDDGQSIVVYDEVNGKLLFDAIKNDGAAAFLEDNPDGVVYLPATPE